MIEMMLTMILVAVMTILAIGIFRSTAQRSNFTSAVNQFVADFSYARQLASKTNRYVAIRFHNSGTFYTVLTQNKTGNYTDFSVNKKVYPLNMDQAFDGELTQDFVVNPMGLVRLFPVTANSQLASVDIQFFQNNKNVDSKRYKRTIHINPSGGIKLKDE